MINFLIGVVIGGILGISLMCCIILNDKEEKKMNNFYINIYDKSTNKSWKEEFDSYYLFKKRYNKLRFSNKLVMRGHSSLVD